MTQIRIAAVAAAILALSAAQAFAHAKLVSSTPADKSSGATPARIVLHFDDPLEGKLSGGDITSMKMMMGGKMTDMPMKVQGVTSALDPKDKKTLILTPKAPLGAGDYKVDWHAVSDDAHRTTGAFTFTVK